MQKKLIEEANIPYSKSRLRIILNKTEEEKDE